MNKQSFWAKGAFPEANQDLSRKGTFFVGKSEFRVEGVSARKALLLEK